MKTIIHTPTNDLKHSLDFYQRLNFQVISQTDPTIVCGGKALVEINPDRTARVGLKMFNDDWSTIVKKLGTMTLVTSHESGYMLSDPNGVRIYLIKGAAQFPWPPNLADSEHKESADDALPGNFAGLSIEATDFDRTEKIWQVLGYKKTMGGPEQGYAVYENGSSIPLSLMTAGSCPHLFFNPSLTYFNSGKNLEVIKNLRAAEIPITEEITSFNDQGIVDNVIIRDPGGLGFFIFND